MGSDNRVESPDDEGCHSPGKKTQGPDWNIIRTRRSDEIQTPVGFVNLIMVG